MKIIGIIAIFMLGFIAAHLLMRVEFIEKPLSIGITGQAVAPLSTLDETSVKVYPDRVIIIINNASLSRYAPTGSMLPVLNENSKGIKIPVTSPTQLNIGDIITYKDKNNELIIHRLVATGFDDKGVYYVTKGDNNLIADERIRFEQIQYKLVMLVY
jgi:hypothetical protein